MQKSWKIIKCKKGVETIFFTYIQVKEDGKRCMMMKYGGCQKSKTKEMSERCLEACRGKGKNVI